METHEGLLRAAAAHEAAGELGAAIDALQRANRLEGSASVEQQLVRLRRDAFVRKAAPLTAPAPVPERAPAVDPALGLPATSRAGLDVELLRAAIGHHGSLVVRGLLSDERVRALRTAIDAALAARRSGAENGTSHYHELEGPDPQDRAFSAADGLLTCDSPHALFELLETFYELELDRLASEFLGERPALSIEKCTLRHMVPPCSGSWHQDGAFLGAEIRSLNVWIALSRCGRDAPGLDIMPRRYQRILPAGAFFDWDLSPEVIRVESPGVAPARPLFEAGDAVLFDHLCVHQTACTAEMTQKRYAIESWLFAPSAYPAKGGGLVI